MSLKSFGRSAIILALLVLSAGCSSTRNPESAVQTGDARVVTTSMECRVNRSACIYEGRYEAGERKYAEDEARRLNQASVERLRRMR